MRTLRTGMVIVALLAAAAAILPAQAPTGGYFAYFGTYTARSAKGIYGYRFQPATGALTPLGVMAVAPSPAFLVTHPTGRFLYAANEHDPAIPAGKDNNVSAFAVNQTTGALTLLNTVSSRGEGPCYVAIDKTGSTLIVANYGSGSVAAIPIHADGRLGDAASVDQHRGSSVNATRQTGPHAHSIVTSPDNRFALTADLGIDQVMVYHLDAAKSTLTPNTPAFVKVRPGTGPRHIAFHPSANFVYVNGEMASTVIAFAYEPKAGTLTELQTVSTLPAGFTGNSSTAEIQIDRAGAFLYVSNRGDDSIAIFSIDRATGKLTAAGRAPTGGKTPRYFTFDPTGAFVFAGNQNSGTVTVFRANTTTGGLTPLQTLTDVPDAVAMAFVQAK